MLVAAIVLTMLLASVGAAVVTTSLFRQGAAASIQEQERAYIAASSGIDIAFYELQTETDVTGDGIGNARGEVDGTGYEVEIDPAYAGRGEYTLRGAGSFGASGQAFEVVVTTEQGYPFAFYGRDGIKVGGSFSVDSYDSGNGTYASQVGGGGYAGTNAVVRSDADINAAGGTVWGDAMPGVGGQVLGDPTTVMGSTAPATEAHEMFGVDYSPPVASSGAHTGNLTLSGGVERFDSLKLVGGQRLTINGDTTIYVDGDVDVSGNARIRVTAGSNLTIFHGSGVFSLRGTGLVNENQDPGSFTLLSDTSGLVTIGGTADFHGLVHSPSAPLEVFGNSALFGGCAGASLSIWGSGMLHFDESLLTPAAISSFRVKSARRVQVED